MMMKLLFTFVVAVAIFDGGYAISKKLFARGIAVTNKCAKEFDIDHSIIEDYLKNRNLPDTANMRCAVNCVFEEFNLFIDGRINVDEFKAFHKEEWGDANMAAKADKHSEACNAELSLDGKNKCDAAYEIALCILKKSKEENFPTPDYSYPIRD